MSRTLNDLMEALRPQEGDAPDSERMLAITKRRATVRRTRQNLLVCGAAVSVALALALAVLSRADRGGPAASAPTGSPY